ncbi:uncharacterized protein G2W53_023154 [Senna tora]|uniref:Uncharacterized protein n=1 Tax=Senna tora TaxID=362788 RepID=A0A834TR08_9FABA|nr:uncharacterized protein G2W53_023154 [Senna tora]
MAEAKKRRQWLKNKVADRRSKHGDEAESTFWKRVKERRLRARI